MFQEYEINGLVAGIWENEFMKEVITKSRVNTILGKTHVKQVGYWKVF
jgi:hypothetical protein